MMKTELFIGDILLVHPKFIDDTLPHCIMTFQGFGYEQFLLVEILCSVYHVSGEVSVRALPRYLWLVPAAVPHGQKSCRLLTSRAASIAEVR